MTMLLYHSTHLLLLELVCGSAEHMEHRVEAGIAGAVVYKVVAADMVRPVVVLAEALQEVGPEGLRGAAERKVSPAAVGRVLQEPRPAEPDCCRSLRRIPPLPHSPLRIERR